MSECVCAGLHLIELVTIQPVLIKAHVSRVFPEVHVVGAHIQHTGQRLTGLKARSGDIQI